MQEINERDWPSATTCVPNDFFFLLTFRGDGVDGMSFNSNTDMYKWIYIYK